MEIINLAYNINWLFTSPTNLHAHFNKIFLDKFSIASWGIYNFVLTLYMNIFKTDYSRMMIILVDIIKTEYAINQLEIKGKIINSGFESKLSPNLWFNSFSYDPSTIYFFKTSKDSFVFNIHDLIWNNNEENRGIISQVSDIEFNNQSWIQMDLIKKSFKVINFENANRKVLISIAFPVIYSFIFDISHGICSSHNWRTWRVIKETGVENWIDAINENKLSLNRYQNENKESYLTILIILLLLTFITILLTMLVYCWIKHKVYSKLSFLFKISQPNTNKSSQELTAIAFKLDPLDFRRTSIQSSIRLKAENAS